MPSTRRIHRPGQSLDASRVKAALLPHAEDLFRAAFGKPANASAREWRDRKKGAVSMAMRGERRGRWFDHSAGAGGDLLDLVAVTRCNLTSAKSDFPRVLEAAARLAGLASGPEPWRGFPKPWAEEAPDADAGDGGDWDVATVAAVIDRARAARGTPAAAYLARRGVTDIPPRGLGWLPPVPDLPLRDRKRGALVLWGVRSDGSPMGGQRVLVTPSGRAPRIKVRKPSFGRIGGFPARFPAHEADGADLLVVAEGPESALSIRQATGLECWAVFGVSSWGSAPLPLDRTVILAPDRDAPGSAADRAFRRAVFRHRSRGVDLLIADAPEPEGSKRDLNDTARRAGDKAVRAASVAARTVSDADMERPET
ncbi:MAG: hypothetical protein F4187_10140 [Gemmatimonadetes bacterium]|nr:hypothetical protein [Gemmatimonadota bacterium]